MRIIFLLFVTLFITSACNKALKEKIGITTTGPNEYQVQRSKSLEVPPHYDLPPPKVPPAGTIKSTKEDVSGHLNDGEKSLMDEIEKR
jgi:hypothetical protein